MKSLKEPKIHVPFTIPGTVCLVAQKKRAELCPSVVISLKLEGTFVLHYIGLSCCYVGPPKPNLIVLMGFHYGLG
jgi:hypothetical protein